MMIMSCKVFLIIKFVETYFLSVYLYDDSDDNNNNQDNTYFSTILTVFMLYLL